MLNNLSGSTENEKKMFAIVDKNVEVHIKVPKVSIFLIFVYSKKFYNYLLNFFNYLFDKTENLKKSSIERYDS